MPVVWLWLVMALVGTVWTLRLLRRAQNRAKDESYRVKKDPVRILAGTRVRNKWIWVPAFAFGAALGVLVLVRDALPFDIPSGVSVLEILLLMATAMFQLLLEDFDDQRFSWRPSRKKADQ